MRRRLSVAAKKYTSLAVESGPGVWLRSELGKPAEGGNLHLDRAAYPAELPYGNFGCPGATALLACVESRLTLLIFYRNYPT